MMVSLKGYKGWLGEISKRYRQSQITAAVAVNTEMLKFYFCLGRDIVSMEKDQPWGSGFLKRVSVDLKTQMPDAECFSSRNLYYMRDFYELYAETVILPQVGAKLVGASEKLPQAGAKSSQVQIGHQVGGLLTEVKAGEFEAGHLGQLGLYVSAVNHILKKPTHEPTIGLLVCKTERLLEIHEDCRRLMV